MKCEKRQAENPADAGFCMKCGTKLAHSCPQCGKALPAEARFCMSWGPPLKQTSLNLEEIKDRLRIPESLRQRMDDAAREMAGENRLVTALFADISGFTSLSQSLPTERWFTEGFDTADLKEAKELLESLE